MNELVNPFEAKEKISPNQTLLLGEPIFKNPSMDESKKNKFVIPYGAKAWVKQIPFDVLDSENISEVLANEYLSIASALKQMEVPFRIIVAHRKNIDEEKVYILMRYLGIRGLALDPSIQETSFPRDMMVDFDGETYINPKANLKFPDDSGITSPLGEGGRVLKLGKKVFLPDPRGYVQTKPKFLEDIHKLSERFQFGFLPYPACAEIDMESKQAKIFHNDHIDRVASLIKGKDNRDYLLLDSHYVSRNDQPFGSYWSEIEESCRKLNVTPVIVNRRQSSIPYGLNLEQFADKTVLLTGGDPDLAESVKQIVGIDKVNVTDRPILYYPLFRYGGIRCMLLHAPKKIVDRPMV